MGTWWSSPAHNEADLNRNLPALAAFPSAEVVVFADDARPHTAEVALARGAQVVNRRAHGKQRKRHARREVRLIATPRAVHYFVS